jgi:Ca2+:H+ antiporter
MSHAPATAGSGLPILGALSKPSRIAFVVIVAIAVATILVEFVFHGLPETVIFVMAAIAILGLAWLVGLSTERLGAITGPQVGGILNATFGNIAELIIAFFALQAGLITVVKASLTGSIIGNLLLVLGAAVLAGGLRNGLQMFSQRIAGSNAALLVLAAVGLFIPGVFAASGEETAGTRVEESVLVALVLIVGYGLSLVWQFTNPEATLGGHGEPEGHAGPAWTGRVAVFVLLVAAALLAVLSEILVGSIEPFIEQFGLSELFVGVILIPTIGNLAEHLVAVQLAYKNKIEFAMAVTFGSSLQVALFVAPILVLLGLVVGQPMDLVFQPLEIAAVGVAVAISALIALDGESNWLEGALLMLIYLIIAISFFELRLPIEAV